MKVKDIAIIGFSGVFPDADNVNEFSENLLKGKCSIKDISKTRLFNTTISDENNYRKCGYLEEITLFDNDFFNISLGEAEEITPHQRMLLHEAYKTFENAGYRKKDLKGSNTSVYVANVSTNYYMLAQESTPTLIAGNTNAMLASRVSRFFDLRGAAINVDTTCSSSLTAITIACKDISLEETNMALVCGVNIDTIPVQKDTKIVLGIDAKSETCSPFSENADGTMSGEAVTGVLLKSLEQAEADGDIIYGVIKGFALNQDGGQSSSIMAPSSDAQADVIKMALKKANLLPNDIKFIEAHGTGTKLGDPIEIGGISEVFAPALGNDEKVYVSAVKSNIGHTDGAAGIVGVIKVLLSFKSNYIFPSINALPLSPFIDFEKSKVVIATNPISWDDVKEDNKMRAGVSSFGLMGTNVHMILESYEKPILTLKQEETHNDYSLCFSAESKESVVKYLTSFKEYLKTTDDSLHDISFTQNICREVYRYRYVVSVNSKNDLLENLEDNVNDVITDSDSYIQDNLLLFDDKVAIKDEILEALSSYNDYKSRLVNDAQKSIFIQYFSYQKLLKSGVHIKEMIGIGIGKIVIQVLKEKMSLDDAFKMVNDTKSLNTEDDIKGLELRANKLIGRYPKGLHIIGAGYRGKLGEVFEKLQSKNNLFSVIGYDQQLSENLKALFNLSLDVDFKEYCENEQFSKVELPSYCFDSKRCWLRKTDNPYNPNTIYTESTISSENDDQVSMVEQMRLLWSGILKSEIQENDDFFDFGGHSLNGSQLINKINEKFSLDFDIDDLFDNGTPKEMAEAIELVLKNNPTVLVKTEKVEVSGTIQKLSPRDLYDASFAQKRLWLLAKMSNNTSSLNIPIVISINGVLDFLNLNKAFQTVIQRHESLRTSFIFVDDELKQKVHKFQEGQNNIKYEIKDDLDKGALDNYIREFITLPFDLESNILVRGNVVKVEDNRHIFIITLHHLISDGWSVTVFQKELFSIYNTLCSNKQLNLEPLQIHYKDFSAWQKKEFNTAISQKSESFWLEQFKDTSPLLDLQLQNSRPALKTYNGYVDQFKIPKELSAPIKSLLKEEEITLAMFFGAILKLLLFKLSEQSDITVGLPITNRKHSELENQIGLYLNTLAVRSVFEEDMSIKSFLNYISKTFKEAYKHQDYPLELLLEKLELQKDLSRSPLFDVVFTVQNFLNINILDELDNLTNHNLNLENYELNNNSGAQFDLFFRFIDAEGELFYELEYNTDLFTKETILSYHNFLVNIIRQCTDNIGLSIKEISLISTDELKQVEATVDEFNNTYFEYPKDKTVVDLFIDQSKKTPNNVALKDDDKVYLYDEVNRLSDQIAEYIITTYGEEDKSPIAVLTGRSADMVILLLGILKSGRSYIPLDQNFPEDRLEYIIDNSKVKMLIYENTYSLKQSNKISVLRLEDIFGTISSYEGMVSEKTFSKDTAYIIYTSGSTGKPKGVEIEHQSLVNFLTSIQQQPGITSKDTLFSVTTYSFDISILEFFTPLISGATLYIASDDVLSDPLLIIQKIYDIQPTVIQATPSFYQLLFNAGWKGNDNLKILCGGDLLSESLSERLISHCAEVWNMYGPTETTIWSSMKRVLQPKDASNIGSPLNNTQFYILDEFLKSKPIGFSGAIYISGDGLAKGYYGNDALTKERFINNPFKEDSLLYQTGDVGKWNHKGEIEFLGRNDYQVKIRGFRIELGDIENTILEYSESLKQALVDLKEVNSEKVLVAYLVATSDIDKSDLRAFLQKKLPQYMIPSFYLALDTFPLTPNKKVDRKALPEIGSNDLIRREYKAPTNKIQDQLVTIWEGILGINKIGIKDNFFELGGTSIQIVKLHNRIDSLWPQIINVPDLFEFNSIEAISDQINKKSKGASLGIDEEQEMKFFEI